MPRPMLSGPTRVARRGALAIVAGTAAGQLLALAASPVLSRLYEPSEFGLFSLLLAVALCLGTVGALRFELAIPLPREDMDAHAVVALGLVSAVGVATLGTGVALFAAGPVAAALDEPQLAALLWVVPAVAGLVAVYQVLIQLAIRLGRFAAIARRNLVHSVTTVLLQLTAGVLGFGAGGLIGGAAAGQAVGVASLAGGAGFRLGRFRVSARSVGLVARRYRRFPLVLAPAGLLNAVGFHLPLILIAWWYGIAAAGWFGLTQRVLGVPVMLIGQAVAQVYLSELARSRREAGGRERALFRATSGRLAAVGVACGGLLLVAGPDLFAMVFGDEWSVSGQLAQAMGVALAAQLMASPVSQTLVVFERTVAQLWWDAGRLVVTGGAVLLSALAGLPLMTAVWAYAAAAVLAYAVSWELSRRTLRFHTLPA